jgi:hypothetical protein|tara:strand:+ start:160 stop:543 length:384 start_codon:yes stop_codon:yes gene_type:complete
MVDIKDVSENEIVNISTKTTIDEEKKEIMRKNLLEMIMRQTDYDKETALMKLKYWRFNVLSVIKDYLNPDFNKPKELKPQTTNQRMMSEIRGFCERGQRIYDLQQEKLARRQKKLSQQQENQKINQN